MDPLSYSGHGSTVALAPGRGQRSRVAVESVCTTAERVKWPFVSGRTERDRQNLIKAKGQTSFPPALRVDEASHRLDKRHWSEGPARKLSKGPAYRPHSR
ncbi:hypothetical protein EYF80_022669 [Liparis tanakae]|uniref:Uncharacterized protein n=1 Tax=Liparis tanakae TaxID=230148 RepID=A0A4Z2HMP5_9TELE|nr:hypothetical protein EYF80_022669 [Liparis tanakae]